MKHLSRFLLASLFVLGFSSMQAQDENNPWAIGIGVNAVNFYGASDDTPGMIGNGTAGGGFGDSYFDTQKWNILPSVSRLSVARYIGGGFVFEAAGSVNQIDTLKAENYSKLDNDKFIETENYNKNLKNHYLKQNPQGLLDIDGLQKKVLDLKSQRKIVSKFN